MLTCNAAACLWLCFLFILYFHAVYLCVSGCRGFATSVCSHTDSTQQVAQRFAGCRGKSSACAAACCQTSAFVRNWSTIIRCDISVRLISCCSSGGLRYLWEVCEDSAAWLCSYGVSAQWDARADVQYNSPGLGPWPHKTGTHSCMCTYPQTHINILPLILNSYMQSDVWVLSERAVYELISHAPVSPRLMRRQCKCIKFHPQHQSVFRSRLSSVMKNKTNLKDNKSLRL